MLLQEKQPDIFKWKDTIIFLPYSFREGQSRNKKKKISEKSSMHIQRAGPVQ